MVIVMRTDIGMAEGKMSAQAAHAGKMFLRSRLLAINELFNMEGAIYERITPLTDEQYIWIAGEYKVAVVGIDSEEKLHNVANKARNAGLTVEEVIDNGHTVFEGVKTLTCVAIGPHYPEKFKGITNRLRLLKFEEEVEDSSMKYYSNLETRCLVPPQGWFCTRKKGHEGPCAARDYSTLPE